MPVPKLPRRTILKGLGGVTVGLPLLEEMLPGGTRVAPVAAAVPVRAFNVFFGLGIPAPFLAAATMAEHEEYEDDFEEEDEAAREDRADAKKRHAEGTRIESRLSTRLIMRLLSRA